MYTRCPECETTFKLGVADLRRAQGKVRCGDCNFVFNALEYLAEEADAQAQDELPVAESEATGSTPPANDADPYNHLAAANDPDIEASPPQEDVAPEPDPYTNPDAETNISDENGGESELWSALEPSDDWLSNTGINLDTRNDDGAFAADTTDSADDLPTEQHILPTAAHSSLPTITMETRAPDCADLQAAAENQPVVEPPAEPEFQEASFGTQGAEQDWLATALDAAEQPDGTDVEHRAASDLAGEGLTDSGAIENSDLENTDLPNADVNLQAAAESAEQAEANESPDNPGAPEFDDEIWEKIPGVGATDEDWESVKSGNHKALSEDELLADGLSYTNTELKVISTQEPVEDFVGSQQLDAEVAEVDVDVDEPETEADENATPNDASEATDERADATSVDGHSKAGPDNLNFDLPEEKWNSFFGAEPLPEPLPDPLYDSLPDSLSAQQENEPETEASTDADSHSEEEADSQQEVITELTGSFVIEDSPEENLDEAENTAPEEAPADLVVAVAQPEDIEPDSTQDTAEIAAVRVAAAEIAVAKIAAAEIAAAEHVRTSTFTSSDEPDSSELDDIKDSEEPEDDEPVENLFAVLTATFEAEDFEEQDLEDEAPEEQHLEDEVLEKQDDEPESAATKPEAVAPGVAIVDGIFDVADVNNEASVNAAGKRDFDPHTDTWTGLDNVEDVVMATGIFDAEKINKLRKLAALEEESAVHDSVQAQDADLQTEDWGENEDQASPDGPPTWNSEYANADVVTAKTSRGWLWLSILVIMIIGFPLQLIHHNRDSLATHPSWGDTVRNAYARIDTELYPLWPLESYEIRGHQAVAGESGQDVLDIRTEIAAIGDTAVGLPHLRVILHDRWSNPLAARNFSPQEYAAAADLPADGLIQPNQKISTQVSIVDPGTGAQGYELEICLPQRNSGLICTDQPFK
jgi:predicted Zn finger-like uncharacterized protein